MLHLWSTSRCSKAAHSSYTIALPFKLLNYYYNDIIVIIIILLKYLLAVIDLVPAEVVHVCPGGQLNLTCKTNESYMEWNVTLSQYQRLSRYILSRSGISQSIVQIRIDESNIYLTFQE